MQLKPYTRHCLIALLIVLAGGGIYWSLAPHDPPRPDFTMPDLAGTQRSISEFDGKVLVLNFWATWCIPCRQEIPMLIEAQTQLGDKGLQIVGIAVDNPKPTATFADQYGINYPVLVDLNKGARIQDEYTQPGDPAAVLPYSVIVGRDGRIHASVAGQLKRAQLDSLVQPLLQSQPAATTP